AGLIGTWIVLRGLAFYAHAVGTAAFPGLVLADGLGFSPILGAFGAAVVFALAVEALTASQRSEYGSFTALVLVGAIALGVILAAAEGVVGLWISVESNAPPGAAIAVLAAGVFGIAALGRAVRPSVLAGLAAGLLLLVGATGCGTIGRTGGKGPTVVATTTQIADLVRAVGGDAVSGHEILQPNTDPH